MRISDWSSDVCSSDLPGDVLAEQLLDLPERRVGVLDGVMQQRGDDRRAVELHPGQDLGDLKRMGEIRVARGTLLRAVRLHRSEEHTSELQSLMRISYAVFCLQKKKTQKDTHRPTTTQPES